MSCRLLLGVVLLLAVAALKIFTETFFLIEKMSQEEQPDHSASNITMTTTTTTTTTTTATTTTKSQFVRYGSHPLPDSVLPQDSSFIKTTRLPQNSNYMPEVGNGHIATVVRSNTIFMNGLYNGAGTVTPSHRARIPSSAGFSIKDIQPEIQTTNTYTLDFGRGIFMESRSGDGFSVTLTTYAHRVWTHVLVSELTMTRNDTSTNFQVYIDDNPGPPSDDIDFYQEDQGILRGQTKQAEYPEIVGRTHFFMKLSPTLKGSHSIAKSQQTQTIAAFTSIGVSKQTVLEHYDQAVQSFKKGTLLTTHVAEWDGQWRRGRIDIEGNLTVAKITYGTLYYLYSSLPFHGSEPGWPFIGMSPGGLAHGVDEDDYGGHVFWDQDTWMFPGLALLNAQLGRLLVGTRTRTLDSAYKIAADGGFPGARYPWESAFTGLETCPEKVYSDLEIHVSGDAVMMMRQYWDLTGDTDFFLKERGLELVQQICTFFEARTTYQESDDTFHINGVMPPDEFNFNVRDSVFTNAVVASSFRFANRLAHVFGLPVNNKWSEMTEKLVILHDSQLDYHPEFAGYRMGRPTKQADAVMLNYPLMVEMNTSTLANDLEIYEKTTPIGPAPAMTWGIFLTGWLQLGRDDKAAELFHRSILNAQEPFYVWTENSNGTGATNFLTGMGGHLQAVLNGYGGCRIKQGVLTFDPKMIPQSTKITFVGVDYMNNSFDMSFNDKILSLNLTFTESGQSGLDLKLSEKGSWERLEIGQEVRVQRQSFELRKSGI